MMPTPEVRARRDREFNAATTRAEVDALQRKWLAEDQADEYVPSSWSQQVEKRLASLERFAEERKDDLRIRASAKQWEEFQQDILDCMSLRDDLLELGIWSSIAKRFDPSAEQDFKKIYDEIFSAGKDELPKVTLEQRRAFCDRAINALKQGTGMRYRGVWKADVAYDENAAVTHDGSIWISKITSKGLRPGDGNVGWQVACKRGSNARARA
jgi:hypothetical protein